MNGGRFEGQTNREREGRGGKGGGKREVSEREIIATELQCVYVVVYV